MPSMAGIFIIRTGILTAQNGEGQTFMPMPENFLNNLLKPEDPFHILTVYISFWL
jgi:hypothetical protein